MRRGTPYGVGATHLIVEIANLARPSRRLRRKMLVDSGAAYSIVDRVTLRRLGIRPTGTRTFILADGTEISRDTGAALFRIHGREGPSTSSSASQVTPPSWAS